MLLPPELEAVNRRLPRLAVYSGRTAAWLHGLDFEPCNPIEVTLPMDSRTSHLARVALMRSNLSACEISTVRDLRVTSITRTVADVARARSLVEATVVFDMALHSRKVSRDQLRNWISSHPGFRGVRTLRRAIELAEPASASPMETRLRLLLVLDGLPRPLAQVSLYDDTGMFIGRPDLYYRDHRLAIEYDGATHRDSLSADNRRQNRLLEAGHRILRFTASDVFLTPASVVAQVQRALTKRLA